MRTYTLIRLEDHGLNTPPVRRPNRRARRKHWLDQHAGWMIALGFLMAYVWMAIIDTAGSAVKP